MNAPNLYHCALQYLNLWVSIERHYHEALNQKDEKLKLHAVQKAFASYKVSRNIPRSRHEEEDPTKRFEDIPALLGKLPHDERNTAEDYMVAQTLKLSKSISEHYKCDSTLSLTTKLLWMKYRHPFIIYDSQVKKSLKIYNSDIKEYYNKWLLEYKNQESDILVACKTLPSLHLHCIDPRFANEKYISSICSQPWFLARVFDIFLWMKGSRPFSLEKSPYEKKLKKTLLNSGASHAKILNPSPFIEQEG